MSRSIWKGSFVSDFLLRKNLKKLKFIKVWNRSSVIPYALINKNVFIYNGKEFRKVFITREKVGYKFGEFAYTRSFKKKIEKIKNAIKKR